MEKGKAHEGEREKGEAKNSSVSFSTLREDIVSILDFLERLKNEENQNDVDVDLVEWLKLLLTLISTCVQLSRCDLEQFDFKMTRNVRVVKRLIGLIDLKLGIKYNMHHIITRLRDNVDDYISSCHRSESSAAMTEEQLDFLLQNLHHLSKYCAEKIFPFVSEYGILQKVCGNIKGFHGLKVNGCIEHGLVEYVLPQFQFMAVRVGLFLWEALTDGDSRLFVWEVVKDGHYRLLKKPKLDFLLQNLRHLLWKIILLELEVVQICFTNLRSSTSVEAGHFITQLIETSPDILREHLIHLQEHMVSVISVSTSGARNVHVMIEFLLIILTDMPKDFIHHDKLFDLLARVGALTREVLILVWNLEEEKSKNEESTYETNRASLNLLENIQLLKGDLRRVYLKTPAGSSHLCFPMSDGPLFMHLLLRHLKDLLNSNAYSVALIKEEIELVKKDLEILRSFFVNVEQYKDLWARVLDVAYEANVVIDSIVVRDNGLLQLIFSLPIAIEKIKLIKEEVTNSCQKIPENRGLTVVNYLNKQLIDDKMFVGFEEEIGLIIRKLTSGPKELDVISITGMPGLGKTTLAYKVYNDKLVSSHFDIRAWCTVGQEHDKKKLLEKIFNQVIGSDSKVRENVGDVADKLRKHMFGKRYLIVFDDLWDIYTWDELRRPFPEVVKGCRIILTTREKMVALHAKCCSDPLYLRLLRPEESWELFEKRVFGEENPCPDELLDVGKEIAKNCKGLPLVADLIVGVLSRKEKKKTMWLEVQNNLNSLIFENEVDVMKVIKLSYDHLADHLKPCLLYLASSPKDTEFPVNVLKALWCAEGLVEQTEMKSVEEVAEVYLDNLTSSSLVISFKRSYRIFQIHDLVHDVCLIKAREENLFDLRSSSAPSSSSDLTPRQMSIYYDKHLDPHNNFVMFASDTKRHLSTPLYSLRITGDELDGRFSDKFHLRHLRLLRVLNLNPSFIKVEGSLLNEICTLVHLRYLDIQIDVKSLPLSFSNLWNLETLILKNRRRSSVILLPTIWNLVKLRVLSIHDCCFFDLDTDEPISIAEESVLENLRIFAGLQLSYLKDTEDIFKRFPNLQDLGFQLMESRDCSTERYWFPKLDFLSELEFLRVVFVSDDESSNTNNSVAVTNQWDFHFPSSLKKLWLFEFPLTSYSLATIARLPNLETLTLENIIILGEEWNMGEDDTFGSLKVLRLWGGNLANWELGEESFPVLERLMLQECYKLEEIPPTFGDIDSLKYIKLTRCPPHLEESALKIKQYVEEMTGNDKLKVLVLNEY